MNATNAIQLGRLKEITDEDVLTELASTAEIMDFEKGAVIYERGALNDDTLYLIADGELEVLFDGYDTAGPEFRDELRKAKGPGDVCGESAFFTNAHKRTTLVQVSSSTAKLLRWSNFSAALESKQFRPLKDLLHRIAMDNWIETSKKELS